MTLDLMLERGRGNTWRDFIKDKIFPCNLDKFNWSYWAPHGSYGAPQLPWALSPVPVLSVAHGQFDILLLIPLWGTWGHLAGLGALQKKHCMASGCEHLCSFAQRAPNELKWRPTDWASLPACWHNQEMKFLWITNSLTHTQGRLTPP